MVGECNVTLCGVVARGETQCEKLWGKLFAVRAHSDYGRPGGSARETLNASPRPPWPRRSRDRSADGRSVRVRARAGAPVPAPRGPRPADRPSPPAPTGRRCVRPRPSVCASAPGRIPAAAATPTGRTCHGAGDSARGPINIAAASAGRCPPVACRSSHIGRRRRATRTPNARATSRPGDLERLRVSRARDRKT